MIKNILKYICVDNDLMKEVENLTIISPLLVYSIIFHQTFCNLLIGIESWSVKETISLSQIVYS